MCNSFPVPNHLLSDWPDERPVGEPHWNGQDSMPAVFHAGVAATTCSCCSGVVPWRAAVLLVVWRLLRGAGVATVSCL